MSEINLDQFKDSYSVAGEIERFEGTMAVIKLSDNQKLLWQIKNLPDDLKEGDKVKIILSTSQTEQTEREKISKTILNQILKSSDKKNG